MGVWPREVDADWAKESSNNRSMRCPRSPPSYSCAPHHNTLLAAGGFPLDNHDAVVPPCGDCGDPGRWSVPPADPRPHLGRLRTMPLDRLRPVRLHRESARRRTPGGLLNALIVEGIKIRLIAKILGQRSRDPFSGRGPSGYPNGTDNEPEPQPPLMLGPSNLGTAPRIGGIQAYPHDGHCQPPGISRITICSVGHRGSPKMSSIGQGYGDGRILPRRYPHAGRSRVMDGGC